MDKNNWKTLYHVLTAVLLVTAILGMILTMFYLTLQFESVSPIEFFEITLDTLIIWTATLLILIAITTFCVEMYYKKLENELKAKNEKVT